MPLLRWTLLVVFSSAIALTGCSVMNTTAAPSTAQGLVLQGKVHGGQQPIVGATVNLYAAGTGGYGTSSTLLSSSAATTDGSGSFTITGDYSCTTGQEVYVLATGGNAGGNGTNSAISLMTVLGACPSPGGTSAFATSEPFIWVNEVTTVAAAYVLAPYASDAFTVGSSGTTLAKVGLKNAFNNFFNLAELSTGIACANTAAAAGGDCITAPNSNGTAPQAEINTLANILAACVNTSGPTGHYPTGGNACDTLLNVATSNGVASNLDGGAAKSSDTGTAAIYIAQNPWANIATLCGLQAGVATPFQPTLPCSSGNYPNDFTVGLTFTGNGLNGPAAVALDASGDVWVVENLGAQVSEFTPGGAVAGTSPFSAIFGGTGFLSPVSEAIDASGNVWVTDQQGSFIKELSSSGSLVEVSTNNSLDDPQGIAIDGSGHLWVANSAGNHISEFTSVGGIYGNSPFSINGNFGGIAVDPEPTPDIWVADASNSDLHELTSTTGAENTTNSPASPYSGGGVVANSLPIGVAIDANINIWVTNLVSSVLSKFGPTGAPLSGTNGYTGGGLTAPAGVAIDGSNKVWVANSGSGEISEFTNSGTALSPSTGYATAFFGASGDAPGLAIDGSGNIWTADYNNDILVQLVGAASPVVTPIVANLKTPYGTQAVNKP